MARLLSLSMNRPTPDPSQEGNSASVPDIDSPPPEGLGVGSWPRFTSGFWRCSLPMNPLTPSLSPTGGEGGRRPGEGASRGSRGQWGVKLGGVPSPEGHGPDAAVEDP